MVAAVPVAKVKASPWKVEVAAVLVAKKFAAEIVLSCQCREYTGISEIQVGGILRHLGGVVVSGVCGDTADAAEDRVHKTEGGGGHLYPSVVVGADQERGGGNSVGESCTAICRNKRTTQSEGACGGDRTSA